MSGKVNDCCCGFPSGENTDNCERCGLIKQIQELSEALDTLTLVVGLTPVAGNKAALQEAFDVARAALKKARGE